MSFHRYLSFLSYLQICLSELRDKPFVGVLYHVAKFNSVLLDVCSDVFTLKKNLKAFFKNRQCLLHND